MPFHLIFSELGTTSSAATVMAFKKNILRKNSENSIESGEIEGQDKLKDQEEKRIMNYVENINIDAVKKTNSTTTGTYLLE